MFSRTVICLGLFFTACGDSSPDTNGADASCVGGNCPDGGDANDVGDAVVGADTVVGVDAPIDTAIATSPAPPTLSETVPGSPSSSLTPEVKGRADAGSTVSIHVAGDCSDPSLGEGVASVAGDFTITVTVAADAITSLYGRATGAGGLASDCVLLTDYAHDGVAPALTADAPTVDSYDEGGSSFIWRGTAEPGARVTLALAPDAAAACDAAVAAETVADLDGNYALAGIVATDVVSFYGITATDAAGNATCNGSTPLVAPATVRVNDVDGQLAGATQVFVSRDDGALLSEATTQAGQSLDVLVFAGVSVTVAGQDDGVRWLQTHAGVGPAETLFFGVEPAATATPAWVGDVEIIFPGAVAGAVDYTVQTPCDRRESTTSSISLFFSVFDDCVSQGDALSMVIVARDAMGRPLAYTTTRLLLTDGYNPAVPGDWIATFDMTDVELTTTDTAAIAEASLFNVSDGVAYVVHGPASLNLGAMSTTSVSLETLPDFGDYLRLIALFTAQPGGSTTLIARQVPISAGGPATLSADYGSVVPITSVGSQSTVPNRPEWAITSAALPASGTLSRLVASSRDGTSRWTIVGPAANTVTVPMVPAGLAAWAPSADKALVDTKVAWVTHDATHNLAELRALFGQKIYAVSFEDARSLVGDPALFGDVWQASATTFFTGE